MIISVSCVIYSSKVRRQMVQKLSLNSFSITASYKCSHISKPLMILLQNMYPYVLTYTTVRQEILTKGKFDEFTIFQH